MEVRNEVQAPGRFTPRGISSSAQRTGGQVHSTDGLDILGRRPHDINLRKAIRSRDHPLQMTRIQPTRLRSSAVSRRCHVPYKHHRLTQRQSAGVSSPAGKPPAASKHVYHLSYS
jgi:hypothetical protein